MPVTRTSNSQAHPGNRHNEYSIQRRPAEVVQAEREAKAAAQAEKVAKQVTGTKDAAQLEHMARRKVQEAREDSGASSNRLDIPRTSRPRPVSRKFTEGKSTQPFYIFQGRVLTDFLSEPIAAQESIAKPSQGKRIVKKIVYEEIEGNQNDLECCEVLTFSSR